MSTVTLWHIAVSHYNEKVRWALAWKGVEHQLKAPMPGLHQLIALTLTRGSVATFPVLQLDGENIGDSTAIIAALEERFPEPPLYPSDPAERERALALEDFFDEELGPHIRLYTYSELMQDEEGFTRFAESISPAPLRRWSPAVARRMLELRFGVNDDAKVERAQTKVLEALDRLEAELGDGEYLVGDEFSVADLAAASLFYPLAWPPEGPKRPGTTETFERFQEPLRERPGYRWILEMFARHREPARARAAA